MLSHTDSHLQQRGDLYVYSQCDIHVLGSVGANEGSTQGQRHPEEVGQPHAETAASTSTDAALLSPFLVSWLQLFSSVPQEDVVLFLGVVILVALKGIGSRQEK